MKKCSKCKKLKELFEFYRDGSRPDGLRSCCKYCDYTGRCKDRREYQRAYYRKHKEKWNNKWVRNNTKAWALYFVQEYGEIPKCGICDRTLVWYGQGAKKDVVHWDHKNGYDLIKWPISLWIRRRPCNTKNINLFKKASLGILCNVCNRYLPSENRKIFCDKLLQYIGVRNSAN